jgi:hypothetical protein
MSGHAQKFGGNFPQIFVVKVEKMKVVRKTPEFTKKVKISCIYKFLVVDNRVGTFICLLYHPERFVLRYDTNFSGWEPQIWFGQNLGRLTPK